MTLVDISNNSLCTLIGFNLARPEFLSRLYALGLTPGATLQVIRRAPMGDPIQVRVNGSLLSIRKADAAGLLVNQ